MKPMYNRLLNRKCPYKAFFSQNVLQQGWAFGESLRLKQNTSKTNIPNYSVKHNSQVKCFEQCDILSA